MSFAMGQRVVFSALYNETDEFLVIFIRNFLLHTGVGEFLIINLPPGRQVHCPIADESDRVFLVSGRTKRQKLGHTLLVGHLEAFDHATEVVGTFEFFCPLASNSMFARQFNLAAATDKLTSSHHEARISLEVLPSGWWWEKLRRNPSAISFLQAVWGLTHAQGAQIEGLFASQRDWELLRQRHSQIVDFGETLTSDTMIPLEEILPATFFCNFGSGNYIHICHNFWNRGPRSPVRLDEIVDISRNLPQEVCLLKWFERDPNHPSTAAVSVGWARDLLSEISNAKKEERAGANLTHRILLEQLSVVLRKEEGFVPLTTRWWTESELSTDTARLVFEQPIRMQGQIVNLLPPLVAGGGQPTAFLFAERTNHLLHLNLTIEQGLSASVSLHAAMMQEDGQDSSYSSRIEAYVYLCPLLDPGKRTFRLSHSLPMSEDFDRIKQNIVIRRGSRHMRSAPMHVVDANGAREYYFQQDKEIVGEKIWFGIPIFGNSSAAVMLDVM